MTKTKKTLNTKAVADWFDLHCKSHCSTFELSQWQRVLIVFDKPKVDFTNELGDLQQFLNDILVKNVMPTMQWCDYDNLCDEIVPLLQTLWKENGGESSTTSTNIEK